MKFPSVSKRQTRTSIRSAHLRSPTFFPSFKATASLNQCAPSGAGRAIFYERKRVFSSLESRNTNVKNQTFFVPRQQPIGPDSCFAPIIRLPIWLRPSVIRLTGNDYKSLRGSITQVPGHLHVELAPLRDTYKGTPVCSICICPLFKCKFECADAFVYNGMLEKECRDTYQLYVSTLSVPSQINTQNNQPHFGNETKGT
jgi:hypothetical protein